MKAHLRASAYEKHRSRLSENADAKPNAGAINRARSFIDFSHEYNTQARSNFTSEAAFFAVTSVAVAWPIIHSLRLLSGAS